MKSPGIYGWRPQLPDQRDYVKLVTPQPTIPTHVDLTPLCPPIYDQGDLGDCTGNGIAAAVQFDLMKQKLKVFVPSRLFIYYNERDLEGTINYDAGATIRDGFKTIANKGVCDEALWPYVIKKFKTKPSANCFTEALKTKSVKYESVNQTLTDLKNVLAGGEIIVFGFTVYESFESQQVAMTGVVPMPLQTESVLGGHCVCIVGYDDPSSRFICRNSWGTGWGKQGYFTMPYNYVTNANLATDFWTVNTVS